MHLNYLNHKFEFYIDSDYEKYICKICNIIVYFNPHDKCIYHSSQSKVFKNLRSQELILSCNDVLIKSIIE